MIIKIAKGSKIRELTDRVNDLCGKISNQYSGLYIHDELHDGHWLEEQDQSIEYYGIRNMDIIQYKDKPIYHINLLPLSSPKPAQPTVSLSSSQTNVKALLSMPSSTLINCFPDTKISEFIKMIICCLPFPVDDPTEVGLCVMKSNTKNDNQETPVNNTDSLVIPSFYSPPVDSNNYHYIWFLPDSTIGFYHLQPSDILLCYSANLDPSSDLLTALFISKIPYVCSLIYFYYFFSFFGGVSVLFIFCIENYFFFVLLFLIIFLKFFF